MKKSLILFTLILTATWSFAADFTPTVMTLSAPDLIEYQFDGTDVKFPFTVTGTPAAVWLVINTKNKAENIADIRNGYLGWHYVNKIDTTVYISERYKRDPGETNIVWDGTDQDGNILAADTYDYYLWAYDDQTPRYKCSEYVIIGFDWDAQMTQVCELGEDGLPMAQPMLMGSVVWFIDQSRNTEDNPWRRHGTTYKWIIGSDPDDITNLQTTKMAMYKHKAQFELASDFKNLLEFTYGQPVFDPNDYSIYYHCSRNTPQKTNTFLKWTFVTDGEAILDEDWMGWDELTLEDLGVQIGTNAQKPSCFTDRNYIYELSPGLHQKEMAWNKIRCVSFDGELIFDKNMFEWYMPDDPNPHDYINGSFHLAYLREQSKMLIAAHTSCLHQYIDTSRLIDDSDDETDMVLWSNQNGDYFMDSAYEPTVEPSWYCLADDKMTSMRRDSVTIDSNGLNIIYASFLGLTSFGVSTQDGTAIDYMAFGDDTVSDNVNKKGGGQLCDSGSNYDGLYMNAPLLADTPHFFDIAQTYYVAFDSVHGVLTNEPVIEPGVEDGPAAFAVDQNSPNPFNPTTSINFTIPGADHVTVDIYNVAGQKVDTLVNDFMDAGTHSVVWDASGFSNGVYFYTVKSGDFSRTMKMTLLK